MPGAFGKFHPPRSVKGSGQEPNVRLTAHEPKTDSSNAFTAFSTILDPIQDFSLQLRGNGLLNVNQKRAQLRPRSCQTRHHGPLGTTQKAGDLLVR